MIRVFLVLFNPVMLSSNKYFSPSPHSAPLLRLSEPLTGRPNGPIGFSKSPACHEITPDIDHRTSTMNSRPATACSLLPQYVSDNANFNTQSHPQTSKLLFTPHSTCETALPVCACICGLRDVVWLSMSYKETRAKI